MPSIFEIERRLENINDEMSRVILLLEETEIMHEMLYRKLIEVMSVPFLNWPNRGRSISFKQYLSDLGITYGKILDNTQSLYFMEFLLNYIDWLYGLGRNNMARKYYTDSCYEEMVDAANPIVNQIHEILELLNFKPYRFKQDNTIRLVKRDEILDSILDEVSEKDIQTDLLSFLDFRNVNNLIEKKSIIARLSKHFEKSSSIDLYSDVRVKKNGSTKDILPFDDFNYVCNNYDVRHGKDSGKGRQIKLPEKDTINLCNITYYMFLQAILVDKISKNHEEIEELKAIHNK